MREIKAKELTKDNFCEFGEYYDLLDLKGNNLGDFYPDHLKQKGKISFSGLKVHKKDEMIIDSVEFHNHSEEIILPLDTDIVIHVAPPSVKEIPNKTEAFIIKKGTIVKLNIGIFHLAPFSIDKDEGRVMIGLPERTYFNDCTIVNYKKEDYIKIIL